MYYVGQNDPEWKLSIKNTLTSTAMTEYVNGLVEDVEVEDPKKHLAYLWVEETVPETTEAAESDSTAATEAK